MKGGWDYSMGDKRRRKFISNRKIKMIISGILVIAVIFILSHLTPSAAIRSDLFFKGYFIKSIIADIEFNEEQHNLDKETLEDENSKIYTVKNKGFTDRNGFLINNFKVKKVGFLYFANNYGEA